MARRLVVADASPLIGLAAAGAFDLLRRLFGQVTITNSVRDEVLTGGERPGAQELAEAIRTGWIIVVNAPFDASVFPDLGAGEASTLCFAMGRPGPCLVLMDDLAGRAHAHANGLALTGLAGVLIAARKHEYIDRVSALIEKLEGCDFRLSREVVDTILELAGSRGPRRDSSVEVLASRRHPEPAYPDTRCPAAGKSAEI